MTARLLLAEDDNDLRPLLVELLEGAGYAVTAVRDGASALQAALNQPFDLAVLDRGMPFVDGVDLIRRLRSGGWAVPVLVLSAYGSAPERVEGLDAGAEDYLAKPFDVEELLARLRALLRRHLDAATVLRTAAGDLDPSAHLVLRPDGSRVELSPKESELLRILASAPSQVFDRDQLRGKVFADAESDGIVDTYVHYLRRKLGKDAVRTVTGVGYQLGPPR